MKSTACFAVLLICASTASYAQQAPASTVSPSPSNAPMTRAQANQQLQQLESAGYNPGENDYYYPNNLQAAQQRVAAGQGSGQPVRPLPSVVTPQGSMGFGGGG
ncbi:MAG: DUF4148 domain-containing protein [Janthinobacterium lividum]